MSRMKTKNIINAFIQMKFLKCLLLLHSSPHSSLFSEAAETKIKATTEREEFLFVAI